MAKIRAINADIEITKTTDNLKPKVGETLHDTVTATNDGPATASGLKVTDSLPAALTYQSSTASTGTYTSGTGIWNIGTLSDGATATLTIEVKRDSKGEVTNTAAVSALKRERSGFANDSDSVSVTVKNNIRSPSRPAWRNDESRTRDIRLRRRHSRHGTGHCRGRVPVRKLER